MPEVLSTDHVNYLIWRYLQEYGYGATAVQFMRDWRKPDPQQLPFASAVSKGDLISLIIHGLKFDDTAHQIAQEPRKFTFLHCGPKRDGVDPDEPLFPIRSSDDNINAPRKRQKVDPTSSTIQHSKTKKPNAFAQNENGVYPGDASATPRDFAEPPQVEPEPPKPPPTTAEIGSDAQVQTDEVPKPPVAKTLYKERIEGTDIVYVAFHPTDANVLETAGGSLFRKLRVITEPEDNADESRVEVEVSDVCPNKEKPFYVTAYSRSPEGDQLALAVEHGNHRTISFGRSSFPQVGPMHKIVLSLDWNQTSKVILATMSGGEHSAALLWDNKNANALAEVGLSKTPLGATWLSTNSFALVGDGFIDVYNIRANHSDTEEPSPVVMTKSIVTDRPWFAIRYDPSCGRLACGSASDTGLLGTVKLNSDDKLELIDAHEGPVTGVLWQPLTTHQSAQNGNTENSTESQLNPNPLLASSSLDGTVKLWDLSDKPHCVQTFETDAPKEVVALSFSPDGKHIAAACDDETISVWEVKEDGKIVAVWALHPKEDDDTATKESGTAKVVVIEQNGVSMGNGEHPTAQDSEQRAQQGDKMEVDTVEQPVKTNGETASTAIKEDHPHENISSNPTTLPEDDPEGDPEDDPEDDSEEEYYHSLSWNVNCDKLAYGHGDMLAIIHLPQCRNEVYRHQRSPEPKHDENSDAKPTETEPEPSNTIPDAPAAEGVIAVAETNAAPTELETIVKQEAVPVEPIASADETPASVKDQSADAKPETENPSNVNKELAAPTSTTETDNP